MSEKVLVRLMDRDGYWTREVSWTFSVEDALAMSYDDWDELLDKMRQQIRPGANIKA